MLPTLLAVGLTRVALIHVPASTNMNMRAVACTYACVCIHCLALSRTPAQAVTAQQYTPPHTHAALELKIDHSQGHSATLNKLGWPRSGRHHSHTHKYGMAAQSCHRVIQRTGATQYCADCQVGLAGRAEAYNGSVP